MGLDIIESSNASAICVVLEGTRRGSKKLTLRADMIPVINWSMSLVTLIGETAVSSLSTWKTAALILGDLSRSCREAAFKITGTSAAS